MSNDAISDVILSKTAILLEIGECLTRVGYTLDSSPRVVVANAFVPKVTTGAELSTHLSPFSRTLQLPYDVYTWIDVLRGHLSHVFSLLGRDSQEPSSLVLITDPDWTTNFRTAILRALSELNIDRILLKPSTVFALGPDSDGVVIDVSRVHTRIRPVLHGHQLPTTIIKGGSLAFSAAVCSLTLGLSLPILDTAVPALGGPLPQPRAANSEPQPDNCSGQCLGAVSRSLRRAWASLGPQDAPPAPRPSSNSDDSSPDAPAQPDTGLAWPTACACQRPCPPLPPAFRALVIALAAAPPPPDATLWHRLHAAGRVIAALAAASPHRTKHHLATLAAALGGELQPSAPPPPGPPEAPPAAVAEHLCWAVLLGDPACDAGLADAATSLCPGDGDGDGDGGEERLAVDGGMAAEPAEARLSSRARRAAAAVAALSASLPAAVTATVRIPASRTGAEPVEVPLAVPAAAYVLALRHMLGATAPPPDATADVCAVAFLDAFLARARGSPVPALPAWTPPARLAAALLDRLLDAGPDARAALHRVTVVGGGARHALLRSLLLADCVAVAREAAGSLSCRSTASPSHTVVSEARPLPLWAHAAQTGPEDAAVGPLCTSRDGTVLLRPTVAPLACPAPVPACPPPCPPTAVPLHARGALAGFVADCMVVGGRPDAATDATWVGAAEAVRRVPREDFSTWESIAEETGVFISSINGDDE